MDATKVTTGKPSKSGAIYCAPIGTQLPTSASAQLNSAFKDLGYISEDGFKNSNTATTDSLKAWGGDTVLNMLTEKPDTFAFKLIEAMNEEVLKAVYGADNVETITVGSGEDAHEEIKISANSDDYADMSWVVDMILKGGKLKRIVIPNAKITEVGEITYTDSDAVGYDTTISAVPDSMVIHTTNTSNNLGG